jgi:hypothetical protein
VIEELYIAYENGSFFFTLGNFTSRQMIVPFCQAIGAFSKECMKARIKSVQLDNGKCIYLKELMLMDSVKMRVIMIATDDSRPQDIENAFIKVKWEIGKKEVQELMLRTCGEYTNESLKARIGAALKETR